MKIRNEVCERIHKNKIPVRAKTEPRTNTNYALGGRRTAAALSERRARTRRTTTSICRNTKLSFIIGLIFLLLLLYSMSMTIRNDNRRISAARRPDKLSVPQYTCFLHRSNVVGGYTATDQTI